MANLGRNISKKMNNDFCLLNLNLRFDGFVTPIRTINSLLIAGMTWARQLINTV